MRSSVDVPVLKFPAILQAVSRPPKVTAAPAVDQGVTVSTRGVTPFWDCDLLSNLNVCINLMRFVKHSFPFPVGLDCRIVHKVKPG